MTVPCHGCAEREIGCHANCQRYQDFADERMKMRRDEYEAKQPLNTHISNQVKRWVQIWRRTKS